MQVVLRWSTTNDADALLRRTVAAAHGVDPGDVVVTRRCPRCGSARHGAPLARVAGRCDVAVSVSRAGGLTVVALVDGPVLGLGTDVEPLDRPAAGLLDVLGPNPRRSPGATSVRRPVGVAHVDAATSRRAADRTAADGDVLRRWVRVEAVLKAAGVGLTVDPRGVAVEPPDRVVVPAGVDAPQWWVADTTAVPGCVGAVALRLPAPLPPGGPTLDATAG